MLRSLRNKSVTVSSLQLLWTL